MTNAVSPVIYGSKTTGGQENKQILTNAVSPVIYDSKTTKCIQPPYMSERNFHQKMKYMYERPTYVINLRNKQHARLRKEHENKGN